MTSHHGISYVRCLESGRVVHGHPPAKALKGKFDETFRPWRALRPSFPHGPGRVGPIASDSEVRKHGFPVYGYHRQVILPNYNRAGGFKRCRSARALTNQRISVNAFAVNIYELPRLVALTFRNSMSVYDKNIRSPLPLKARYADDGEFRLRRIALDRKIWASKRFLPFFQGRCIRKGCRDLTLRFGAEIVFLKLGGYSCLAIPGMAPVFGFGPPKRRDASIARHATVARQMAAGFSRVLFDLARKGIRISSNIPAYLHPFRGPLWESRFPGSNLPAGGPDEARL